MEFSDRSGGLTHVAEHNGLVIVWIGQFAEWKQVHRQGLVRRDGCADARRGRQLVLRPMVGARVKMTSAHMQRVHRLTLEHPRRTLCRECSARRDHAHKNRDSTTPVRESL